MSIEPAIVAAIPRLVARGLASAESLSPREKADLYAAAGHILREVDGCAADLASSTAGFIRATEEHQLKFAQLLQSL